MIRCVQEIHTCALVDATTYTSFSRMSLWWPRPGLRCTWLLAITCQVGTVKSLCGATVKNCGAGGCFSAVQKLACDKAKLVLPIKQLGCSLVKCRPSLHDLMTISCGEHPISKEMRTCNVLLADCLLACFLAVYIKTVQPVPRSWLLGAAPAAAV